MLGLRVAGESENYGIEQEHLNNVFGARLRITALRAPPGPGIELLEYLAPRDGRPTPADLRANDLAHWQTTLRRERPVASNDLLRPRIFTLVSPNVVALPTALARIREGVARARPRRPRHPARVTLTETARRSAGIQARIERTFQEDSRMTRSTIRTTLLAVAGLRS